MLNKIKLTGADEAASSALDRADQINENLSAASAIIDCVRVLAALERCPMVPTEDFAGLHTGHGSADGAMVRDKSMSAALYHALSLIDKSMSAALYHALSLIDKTEQLLAENG